MQVTAREDPLEWFGGTLVAGLEGHQAPLQVGQAIEVARGEQLALNDREVSPRNGCSMSQNRLRLFTGRKMDPR